MFNNVDWKKLLIQVLILFVSAIGGGTTVNQLSPAPQVTVEVHTEDGKVSVVKPK